MTSRTEPTSEGGKVQMVSPDFDHHKPRRGQVPLHGVDVYEAIDAGLGVVMFETEPEPLGDLDEELKSHTFRVTYVNPTVRWSVDRGGYIVDLDKAEAVYWERVRAEE